jgi:hypothetical protein
MSISPIFGFGLGSTGLFDISSDNAVALEGLGFGFLNKLDSYSMFFRLGIELGGISLFLLLLIMVTKFLSVERLLRSDFKSNIPQFFFIFNFFFSTCLIIGVLIKEPTFGRSLVYIGFFLFFTSELNYLRASIASRSRMVIPQEKR